MSMVILLKLLIWFEVGLLLACPGGCLFVTETPRPPPKKFWWSSCLWELSGIYGKLLLAGTVFCQAVAKNC